MLIGKPGSGKTTLM
jgi:hypothetical protein